MDCLFNLLALGIVEGTISDLDSIGHDPIGIRVEYAVLLILQEFLPLILHLLGRDPAENIIDEENRLPYSNWCRHSSVHQEENEIFCHQSIDIYMYIIPLKISILPSLFIYRHCHN